MRHVYMLIHQVGSQAGGMTLSMMTRANLFSRHGWRAALVTTDEKRDYGPIEEEYWSAGSLDRDVRIINLFDHHRARAGEGTGFHREYGQLGRLDEPGMFHAAPAGTDGRGQRYFETDSGRYRLWKQWRADGTLDHVDFFNDAHTRVKRVEFDARGLARRELTYDPYGSIVIQDRFFTTDGFCFLIRWHGVKDKTVYKVLLFDRAGNVTEYNSSLAWEVAFLDELAAQGDARPVFIGDGIGAIGKLPQVTANGALRYMQIHSNHLQSPLLGGTGYREDHAKVFRQARTVDGVVLLTEKQRKDVVEDFGIADVTHTIPHSFSEAPALDLPREPNSAVTVGRLSEEKSLDSAIRVFRAVVDEIPDAVYRIYGTGPEKDKLTALIKELGLTENVFLEGFTAESEKAMARAQVFLMTSVFEGLPLSVAESCLQETPVVAFDINYGPSDIVPSDRHGSILPTRDEKQMSLEIIRYFRSDRLRRKTGERARSSVLARYGAEAVYAQWQELVG